MQNDQATREAPLNDDAAKALAPNATAPATSGAWQACLDSVDVLQKSLQFGRVRGIVTIDTCERSDEQIFDQAIFIAKELIARDMMVTLAGCPSSGLNDEVQIAELANELAGVGVAEVCELIGVDPIIVEDSSPGSPAVRKLYQTLAFHFGSEVHNLPIATLTLGASLEEPSLKATLCSADSRPHLMQHVDSIEGIIHEKRLNLGWADRFHCSMETYS